jgi:hypothetical protein
MEINMIRSNKTNTAKTMTQKERVRSLLTRKTRNTITPSQAEREFGIKNLRARISELRDDGLNIQTDFRTNRDGSVEAVYSL